MAAGSRVPTIPGYDGLEVIGRGGFATVYRARDSRFNRDVAIKVLTDDLDDTARSRFERECRAVGALSGHPAIVAVHDSGVTDDGRAYLVMEFLSGGTLAARLGQAPLTPEAAISLGVALSGALETAHRAGVLHRDVKPENVMYSAYGTPKLVDFGIATIRGGYETRSAAITASVTHAAPEVISGAKASPASDIYSLGSTIFHALTGRPAFSRTDDETLVPLIARIATAPVPDLRPQGAPDALAAALERAMAKDPEARFGSAGEFGQALASAASDSGALATLVVAPLAPAPDATDPGERARGEVATDPTQTVGRRREPPAPAPAATDGQRTRKRMLIGAAAVAAVLAAGAVVVTLNGDDGATPAAAAGSVAPTGSTTASPTSGQKRPSSTPKPTARKPTKSRQRHSGGGSTGSGGAPSDTRAPSDTSPTTTRTSSGGSGGGVTKSVTAPGSPAGVVASNVVIASRTSTGMPTGVTLSLRWSRGSGGSPSSYCVRSTLMQGGSAMQAPRQWGCASGTGRSYDVAAVNTADGWLKWEVMAKNKAGSSSWRSASPVVPYCIGGKDYDATQKLRAIGLRPNYDTAGQAPSAAKANQVVAQSPTGGATAPGTLIYIKSYGDFN